MRGIVYRPALSTLLFWFGGCAALLVFIAIVHSMVQLPLAMLIFGGVIVAAVLLAGLPLLFSFVRISEVGIEQRAFRHWAVRWEEIEAWSQAADGQPVFLRTRDGRVRGFHEWIMWSRRYDQLAAALAEHRGPPATGARRVVPPLIGSIVDSVVGERRQR